MSAAPEDHSDLYCIRCGYSLQGLPGDPVRCPECGVDNPISGAWVPEEFVSLELRRPRRAAIGCVLLFVVAMPFLVMMLALPLSPWSGPLVPEPVGCPLFALVSLTGIWLVFAAFFHDACGKKPGWISLLALYHLVGLLVASIIGAPVFCSLCPQVVPGWLDSAAGLVVWALLAALMAVIAGKRLQALHLAVCQETALAEARARVRSLMSVPKGGRWRLQCDRWASPGWAGYPGDDAGQADPPADEGG